MLYLLSKFEAIPPRGAKRPSWWNREGIGRAVLNEGLLNCTRVVVEFLTKALTAGSETDIKTVGADEDDGKKVEQGRAWLKLWSSAVIYLNIQPSDVWQLTPS